MKDLDTPLRMFIHQITSGRFILTIIASICFLRLVWTISELLISKAELLTANEILLFANGFYLIIQGVFFFYFNKRSFEQNNTDSNGK